MTAGLLLYTSILPLLTLGSFDQGLHKLINTSNMESIMSGEMNINILLGSMEPVLNPIEYVFCTLKHELDEFNLKDIWAIIREQEAITVIIERATADKLSLSYQSVFKRITLNIHSSLDAVGLTAAVSTKLAVNDISANVIAAFYHDHIFIQMDRADKALSCLNELIEDNVKK